MENDHKIFEAFDYYEEDTDGEDFLFEMANLFQKDTGLPMIIWADVNRRGKHNSPRIKVSTSHSANVHEGELVPVLLSEKPRILPRSKQGAIPPDDLKEVGRFISLNKEILMQYWNGTISTSEFVSNLKHL